jgi:hypothetical protein
MGLHSAFKVLILLNWSSSFLHLVPRRNWSVRQRPSNKECGVKGINIDSCMEREIWGSGANGCEDYCLLEEKMCSLVLICQYFGEVYCVWIRTLKRQYGNKTDKWILIAIEALHKKIITHGWRKFLRAHTQIVYKLWINSLRVHGNF